jgi:hypothetical protein
MGLLTNTGYQNRMFLWSRDQASRWIRIVNEGNVNVLFHPHEAVNVSDWVYHEEPNLVNNWIDNRNELNQRFESAQGWIIPNRDTGEVRYL